MDDPGEFFDPVARLYDEYLEASDAAFTGDVGFYRELARETDGPALELGVGTGRVYLELLADGLNVDGIDLSEAMLAELQEKATERGVDPSVWADDVTDLDPDREYGLVYAPARVFNHLTTLSDQRAALERIHDALAPGGRVALNTFVPGFEFVAEHYGKPEEQEVTVDGTTYRLVTTTTMDDPVEQVARHHRAVYRDDDLVAERETPLALIPKRQFELLFDDAGFTDWQVYGGFDREPLESTDQEMVWVVEA